MISYVALSKIIKLRSDMKIYIYLLAKLKEKVGYVPIILSATPHRIVIHRLWKKKVGMDGRPSPNLQKIVCNYSCHP